ncbi:MAG: 5-oxoprolinase subunit PxpB [Acidobacteria bacterium]|nr:5-oxoprolinase subunit PxpB [Acidobacteriota bacterium]MCA1609625.1 5-oxoprolinase subunit PxpB [Acidobacteriota bacterium]
MTPPLRVRHVSDGAILVEFPEASEEEANRSAVALARALARSPVEAPDDAVPGARTLFCTFDPERISHRELAQRIEALAAAEAPAETASGKEHVLRVAYGGPDLASVARLAGLTPDEVARRHASALYRVAFLGFAPGFAYLTGLPAELAAPRLATPRPRVPAGSLAVAGGYSGIYPAESPGGWNLIGRAAALLFDRDRDPPALLAPGDRVRFDAAGELPENRPSPARALPAGIPVFRVVAAGIWSAPVGPPFPGRGASGIPPSGAMDELALADGNALLENPAGAAALEFAVAGPELEALEDATVAISGAPCDASVGGRPIAWRNATRLRKGDRLALGAVPRGVRSYLCVTGGLAPPGPLDIPSRTAAGEVLFRSPGAAAEAARACRAPAGDVEMISDPVVRIVLGPQEDWFADEGVAALLNSPFRVSSTSDRRGIRLEGPVIAFRAGPEIPPEGTALGAIQVPGDGQPIVLGPDRPVTGGYPKIGTVISRDFRLVAQARPGAFVRFRAVSAEEAVAARRRMTAS